MWSKASQEADVVIEREFTTATVHQGYIEPHNATAMWNPDGQLTIWESTQGAFTVQRQLRRCWAFSVAQIRVIPAEIGGGFGAKSTCTSSPSLPCCPRKQGIQSRC